MSQKKLQLDCQSNSLDIWRRPVANCIFFRSFLSFSTVFLSKIPVSWCFVMLFHFPSLSFRISLNFEWLFLWMESSLSWRCSHEKSSLHFVIDIKRILSLNVEFVGESSAVVDRPHEEETPVGSAHKSSNCSPYVPKQRQHLFEKSAIGWSWTKMVPLQTNGKKVVPKIVVVALKIPFFTNEPTNFKSFSAYFDE